MPRTRIKEDKTEVSFTIREKSPPRRERPGVRFWTVFILSCVHIYTLIQFLVIHFLSDVSYDAWCEIDDFYNNEWVTDSTKANGLADEYNRCEDCLFNIRAEYSTDERNATFYSYAWEMEFKVSYYHGIMMPTEEPFKCCDTTHFDCCKLQNDRGEFCDYWDEPINEGDICPADWWPCRLWKPELWDREAGSTRKAANRGVPPDLLTLGHPDLELPWLVSAAASGGLALILFFIWYVLYSQLLKKVICKILRTDYVPPELAIDPDIDLVEANRVATMIQRRWRGRSVRYSNFQKNLVRTAMHAACREASSKTMLEPQSKSYMYMFDHDSQEIFRRVGYTKTKHTPGTKLEILTIMLKPGEYGLVNFSKHDHIQDEELGDKPLDPKGHPDTGARPYLTKVEGILKHRGVTTRYALRKIDDNYVDKHVKHSMKNVDMHNRKKDKPMFVEFIAPVSDLFEKDALGSLPSTRCATRATSFGMTTSSFFRPGSSPFRTTGNSAQFRNTGDSTQFRNTANSTQFRNSNLTSRQTNRTLPLTRVDGYNTQTQWATGRDSDSMKIAEIDFVPEPPPTQFQSEKHRQRRSTHTGLIPPGYQPQVTRTYDIPIPVRELDEFSEFGKSDTGKYETKVNFEMTRKSDDSWVPPPPRDYDFNDTMLSDTGMFDISQHLKQFGSLGPGHDAALLTEENLELHKKNLNPVHETGDPEEKEEQLSPSQAIRRSLSKSTLRLNASK